jgi:hypothetical protein
MIDLADPDLDPFKLSLEDKIELIRQCDGLLIDLLKGERINGSLYLNYCSSLRELPDNLRVSGNLSLDGCSSLVELPVGLKVNNLWLSGCSSLEKLPDNLRVGGWLDLRGCVSLVSLPEGLEVGESLYLGGCSSLPEELPKSIKVGGRIVR